MSNAHATKAALALALLLTLAFPLRTAGAEELKLTVKQAVTRALAHNLSLKVQRLDPALSEAPERVAEAAFEADLFAEVSGGQSPGQLSSQRAGTAPTASTNVGGKIGARKSFSTGTSLEASVSTTGLFGGSGLDPAYQSGVSLSVNQSLLRGISPSANELAITGARQAREAARRKLARQAEQVAASTLTAYFDLHAALAQDRVQALAIQVAETTLAETKLLIAAGKVAGSEEISVRYRLQTLKRDKLATAQAIDAARDKLARLMGMVPAGSPATPAIATVETAPRLPGPEELTRLRRRALEHRGDYLAALTDIAVEQSKLEAAGHALLPKLDLVGSVYASGLSGTATGTTTVTAGESYWSSYEMDQLGWSAGLQFALPLGNERAEGERDAASMRVGKAKAKAEALQQSIVEELNGTWRAVTLARDQLELTELAGQAARTKLRNEELRYKAGKTTAHILASVQADATTERLRRVKAAADLNKSLVQLHTSAGDLLARLGVSPDREPVGNAQ